MVFGVDDLISGGLSAWSQAETNATNVAMAEAANQTNMNIAQHQTQANQQAAHEAMKFEAGQSRQQMQFQERMSSSAYQRAKLDMQKAGINPMLAVQQGGASSPSGAMAGGKQSTAAGAHVQAARVENALGRGLASALETRRLRKDIQATDSTVALQDAQKAKANEEKKIAASNAKIAASQVPAAAAKAEADTAAAHSAKTYYDYGGYWADKLGLGKYLDRLPWPKRGGGSQHRTPYKPSKQRGEDHIRRNPLP